MVWRGTGFDSIGIGGAHSLFEFHVEGVGQECREGKDARSVGCRESDRCVREREFGQHLAAGAAGRAGGVVQVGDGDGMDANVGSELGNGGDES